ncbi:response regulator receiver protein [Gloeothece citriformis PCC 7424]|uniref:Response regulator receiver protein n=1 Tax=Gloeothece citriformis (strain PCC 7424) TaxID=65393 RepID=B7KDT4_GLOC7|nr:response regulator [Gloeothece citriformis]ACK70386.1 response regulator receiver protein [Gloeothece citriformis PCC 7424]
MNTATNLNFSFQLEELPKQLLVAIQQIPTGSCRFQLTLNDNGSRQCTWYLTVVQSRVVYSGIEPLSWSSFQTLLKRYLLPLRTAQAQKQILQLIEQFSSQERNQVGTLIKQIEKAGIITHQQVIQGIQNQLLADFDTFLFRCSGSGEFIPEPELIFQAQLPGFKLEDLISRAKKRQAEWDIIKTRIPSMQCSPILNTEAINGVKLPDPQKQQIQLLVSSGKTLEEIAYKMGNDSLELAKVFLKLMGSGLVSLSLPNDNNLVTGAPEIFIIDDSPLIIKQFKTLVSSWGYQVNTCQNPLLAVEQLLRSKASMIFVDINMPGLSGFDLIKQIRRQPNLAEIPLVLLTAENSISNQWRAQWANCQFLVKPRSREEVSQFRTELKKMLPNLSGVTEEPEI